MIKKSEYYKCKVHPYAYVSGENKALIGFSDIIQITAVYDSIIRFDVLTGPRRFYNDFVNNESELLSKFSKVSEAEAMAEISSQKEGNLQWDSYLTITPYSCQIKGVDMRCGDVLYIESIDIDPQWRNSTTYIVNFLVKSGRSKGKTFALTTESFIDKEYFKLLYVYNRDITSDLSPIRDAIDKSDKAWREEQKREEAAKAKVETETTSTPAPTPTDGGNVVQKNKYSSAKKLFKILGIVALITGGIYLIKRK